MLKIELRRSAAIAACALILLVGLGDFYLLPGPWSAGTDAWTEEWNSLAIWQRWALMLTWPIALGAGAWQGRRDRRATMDELLSTMPKHAISRAIPPVLAMSVGVTAAYLVFFLVGAVQVAGNAGYVDLGWVPVMGVGILSMVAAVLVGMGIGRIVPYLLTTPVVAVCGLLATIIAFLGSPDQPTTLQGAVSFQVTLLSPVLDAPRDLFVLVSAKVNLVQATWFLGLALTGFGLLALVRRKAMALIPAAVALAIALPLLPSSAAEMFTPNPEAAALVCDDRVCVSRLHEDRLAEVRQPAKEALAQLAKLPGAPARVEEARVGHLAMDAVPQASDVVYFHFDDVDFYRDMRRAILAGPDLVQCHDWDKAKLSSARRMVVASWFDGKLAPVAPHSWPYPEAETIAIRIWDELRALPADQQPARVASLRAIAREC